MYSIETCHFPTTFYKFPQLDEAGRKVLGKFLLILHFVKTCILYGRNKGRSQPE